MMFKKKITDTKKFLANGYEVGDVVEFFKDGSWMVGEIEESSDDHSMIIWNCDDKYGGMNYGTVGLVEIRKNDNAKKRMAEYYKEEIKELEDIINHSQDKQMLAEYKAKLKSVVNPNKAKP